MCIIQLLQILIDILKAFFPIINKLFKIFLELYLGNYFIINNFIIQILINNFMYIFIVNYLIIKLLLIPTFHNYCLIIKY